MRRSIILRNALTAVSIIAVAALSVWYLWDTLGKEQLELQRHPIEYGDIVAACSAEFGVPEEMIFAVIHTESNFDPEAVSRAGAKGLMQIVEPTNEWIAFRMGEEPMNERLFEPEFSIRRGTWLLAYTYDKYGSWEVALAAYNAGIGNANKWLQNPDYSSDGVTLDVIPFGETREYVKRVLEAAEKYRRLYFENNE